MNYYNINYQILTYQQQKTRPIKNEVLIKLRNSYSCFMIRSSNSLSLTLCLASESALAQVYWP